MLEELVLTRSYESTATFILGLGRFAAGGITHPIEQLALRYLIDRRACPLCLAQPSVLCYTYGSQNLRRTHLDRLLGISDLELEAIVHWAQLEDRRQRRDS